MHIVIIICLLESNDLTFVDDFNITPSPKMLSHIARARLSFSGISLGQRRALSIVTAHPADPIRQTPLPSSHLRIRRLNTSTLQPRKVPKSTLDDVPSQAESVGEPAVGDVRRGKLWDSADEAIKDLKSGSTVLSAGQYAGDDLGWQLADLD